MTRSTISAVKWAAEFPLHVGIVSPNPEASRHLRSSGSPSRLAMMPTVGPSGTSGPLGCAVQEQADGSRITREPSLACIISHVPFLAADLFSVWFSVIRGVPGGNKAF